MNIKLCKTSLAKAESDAVVVGLFSDGKPTGRAVEEADRATDGLLSKLVERKEITGKKFELVPLLAPPGIAAAQLLVVGLGERNKFDAGTAYRAAAAAAKHLAGKPRKTVAYFLGDTKAEQTENAVAGAIVGCQGQDIYRAEKKRHPFEEILWDGSDDATLMRGQLLAEPINLTRRLVNEPPQDMYPESFATRAAEVAKVCGLEC